MVFKPSFHGICQIHSLSTEVNSRQTPRAFEIFHDVSVTPRVANLWNSEKSDQLLFCHDSRTKVEFTVGARQDGRQSVDLVCAAHCWFLVFCCVSTRTEECCRRRAAMYADSSMRHHRNPCVGEVQKHPQFYCSKRSTIVRKMVKIKRKWAFL